MNGSIAAHCSSDEPEQVRHRHLQAAKRPPGITKRQTLQRLGSVHTQLKDLRFACSGPSASMARGFETSPGAMRPTRTVKTDGQRPRSRRRARQIHRSGRAGAPRRRRAGWRRFAGIRRARDRSGVMSTPRDASSGDQSGGAPSHTAPLNRTVGGAPASSRPANFSSASRSVSRSGAALTQTRTVSLWYNDDTSNRLIGVTPTPASSAACV